MHPAHYFDSALGATIMSVAYGINIKESDDPYIATAEIALEGLAEAGIPGNFWVDIFPILKHVPAWFPAAGFKRKAAYWREVNKDIRKKPFMHVKSEMVSASLTILNAHSSRCPSSIGQRSGSFVSGSSTDR